MKQLKINIKQAKIEDGIKWNGIEKEKVKVFLKNFKYFKQKNN